MLALSLFFVSFPSLSIGHHLPLSVMYPQAQYYFYPMHRVHTHPIGLGFEVSWAMGIPSLRYSCVLGWRWQQRCAPAPKTIEGPWRRSTYLTVYLQKVRQVRLTVRGWCLPPTNTVRLCNTRPKLLKPDGATTAGGSSFPILPGYHSQSRLSDELLDPLPFFARSQCPPAQWSTTPSSNILPWLETCTNAIDIFHCGEPTQSSLTIPYVNLRIQICLCTNFELCRITTTQTV